MLLSGALCGWLGSVIFSTRSLGLFGNIIVGILGCVVGFWIFGEMEIRLSSRIYNTIFTGLAGAVICIVMINLIFPGRKVL